MLRDGKKVPSFLFFLIGLRDRWGIKMNLINRYSHHLPLTHNILLKKEKCISMRGAKPKPKKNKKKDKNKKNNEKWA